MLRAGEADAFAATWPVLRAIADMEGMTVHNAGPTGHSYPLAVGYRGDQPVLGSILQKALDASPPLLEIFENPAGPAWTAEEDEWLADNPIRVAYDPGWFPIEYLDEAGRLSGITAAYVAEFERITGADLQAAQISDWTAALQAVRDRDADVLFMVVNTAERSEYMGFTDPHFTIESVLVAAEDVQLSLDEPGLRVLTIRDYSVEGWLDENYPDIDRISVGSFAEGLAMLRADEADAFVDVWPVVRAIAEDEGMTVYNAGPIGYSYDLSIGYRGDQPVLGSILQKTLDYIPESTLERLQDTTP
jgi:ABC-type amino acid transport substrate-binding protein